MAEEKKTTAVALDDNDLDQVVGGTETAPKCGPKRRSVDEEECTTAQSENSSTNRIRASFPQHYYK
jgi:hypothetical protein